MKKTALITGGSGLVGTHLTDWLIGQGQQVVHLSTRKNYQPTRDVVRSAYWDPENGHMDAEILKEVDVIYHLAGASVSKRWTPAYKQAILQSRLRSTQTLWDGLNSVEHSVRQLLSASAVGIYPTSEQTLYREDAEPAHDFLGSVTQHWERKVQDMAKDLKLPVCLLRIGIVLSKQGGALKEMEPVFKWGLGMPLGNGKQWMSWIHADDLARQFHFCAEQKLQGIFNAGGPEPVTNADFSRALASALKRPYPFSWMGVPGGALKMMLGEKATLALMSQNTSDEKIKSHGFTYLHSELSGALDSIYR